jgi:isopropylmalate/homocitrate/citramalate synthase
MQPWKTDKWFTSPWNFADGPCSELNFSKKIKIHDVSLRDGEQQAGFEFNKDQKIAVAEKLAEIGVHRIEAGMPAVSKSDEDAVKEIVKHNFGPEIFAFARCMKEDVKLAADCGCKGIVTEIPCSEHIIQNAYKWPVERAIDQSIEVTSYAHELGLETIFFPIDATRADMSWFLDTIEKIATEGYMDGLSLADTMGGINPQAAYYLVKKVKERIHVPVEVHFHDDFGLGAANTIFALAAGADVAHTTITGIGERAGNTPFEDVVLALRCLYDIDLGIDLSKLYSLSKFMQKITGLSFRPNRQIVGDTLFNIESGIVTSWYKNCADSCPTEVGSYIPSLVGQKPIEICMGKMSGKPNIEIWLHDLGIDVPKEKHLDLLTKVKDYSLQKGRIISKNEFKTLVKTI